MPTETFRHLNNDKKELFLRAAYEEFSAHSYAEASVSRIVRCLGIAKGSVYQYFKDKRELYFYLLDLASERKFDYIREKLHDQEAEGSTRDFFSLHRDLIRAGTEFDFSYPRYSAIVSRAMTETGTNELGNVAGELKDRSLNFLRDYVDIAVEKGEIRKDIPPDLIAQLVNAMTLSLGTYMEQKYGFSLVAHVNGGAGELPFTREELEAEVDALLRVMKTGLQAEERVR